MCTRIEFVLITCTDGRDRLMRLQAVDGQWSSHTIDFYECTRDGQLQFVMVRNGVQ